LQRQTSSEQPALNQADKPLIIGTRGSPLALWQAHHVRDNLLTAHGWDETKVEIKILKTKGDQIKGHLSEFGGKGLFTRELEEALIDGRIDLAVHSMKDVPTLGQDALTIGAVLERAKLKEGLFDATFLACAGLKRLGQGELITQEVPSEIMLPAPAQGAIGIEHRRDDERVATAILPLDHSPTHIAIIAERAFLEALDGSCRTPIAALATLDKD